jgi:drug/metabolite transporter (DMT)-like permease
MKNQNKAYILALAAILFWSTIASVFKLTLRYLDFLQVILFASAVSIVILFIFLAMQGKISQLKELTPKDYLNSAFLGFLNPFLYYVVLLKAYSLLPAQEAGTLNYTWPVMLVLLSIPLLKQKIGFKNIIAIVISFFGVIIIGTRGDLLSLQFNRPLGVSLAVGSSVVWALYWIFNIRDKRDEIVKLFVNFLFGFVYILVLTVFTNGISLPVSKAMLGITYVGLFEMGITYILWLKALKYSKTTAKVSNLIFLSPFLSLFFINIFVGEKILFSTIIGLVFIVTGILLQQFSQNYKA